MFSEFDKPPSEKMPKEFNLLRFFEPFLLVHEIKVNMLPDFIIDNNHKDFKDLYFEEDFSDCIHTIQYKLDLPIKYEMPGRNVDKCVSRVLRDNQLLDEFERMIIKYQDRITEDTHLLDPFLFPKGTNVEHMRVTRTGEIKNFETFIRSVNHALMDYEIKTRIVEMIHKDLLDIQFKLNRKWTYTILHQIQNMESEYDADFSDYNFNMVTNFGLAFYINDLNSTDWFGYAVKPYDEVINKIYE